MTPAALTERMWSINGFKQFYSEIKSEFGISKVRFYIGGELVEVENGDK